MREAVERLVNYDEWFVRKWKGIVAAVLRLIDHEEISKLIVNGIPAKRIRSTEPAARDLTHICDYIRDHNSPGNGSTCSLDDLRKRGISVAFSSSRPSSRREDTRELVLPRLPFLAIYSIRGMSSKSSASCTAHRTSLKPLAKHSHVELKQLRLLELDS